jgi:ribonuclease D
MGVVVGEIAREHELPQSLLVPRAALDRVAREIPNNVAEFERALELSHWRLTLVGEPLWRLLSGEVHVAIEGYAARDPKIQLLP